MVFQWAIYILLGGMVFWGADAGLMLLGGIVPMRILIVAKTILLPALIVLTVRTATKSATKRCSATARSYLLLAGIWLGGPVDLVFTNMLAGRPQMGLPEMLFQIALFPLSTIVMSLYGGALGGLVIATVILCLYPFFIDRQGGP
jgi:hypothetical protein